MLELRKKAEESKLEYKFEDALAKEDFVSNNEDIVNEKLGELPSSFAVRHEFRSCCSECRGCFKSESD